MGQKNKFSNLAERVKQASLQEQSSLSERLKHAENIVGIQPSGLIQDANTRQMTTFTRESSSNNSVIVENVPIELVDPNPFNARHIYIPERINELATSISASGQLVPGIATKRNERYVLIGGHYRWRAIKLAGLPSIELKIFDNLSDQELYQLSFKENEERSQQSALDNALSWKHLIDNRIYPNESAIAEITGLSLSNINKTLAILKLHQSILEIIQLSPQNYPLSTLYELVLLEQAAGTEVTKNMLERVGSGEVGRKEVTELRAKYETPKERKRKENSRQYKIEIGGKQQGFIKEWDSGKVVLEINLADQKERESLVELLKNRFQFDENTKLRAVNEAS